MTSLSTTIASCLPTSWVVTSAKTPEPSFVSSKLISQPVTEVELVWYTAVAFVIMFPVTTDLAQVVLRAVLSDEPDILVGERFLIGAAVRRVGLRVGTARQRRGRERRIAGLEDLQHLALLERAVLPMTSSRRLPGVLQLPFGLRLRQVAPEVAVRRAHARSTACRDFTVMPSSAACAASWSVKPHGRVVAPDPVKQNCGSWVTVTPFFAAFASSSVSKQP